MKLTALNIIALLIVPFLFTDISCTKFLEEKSDKSLIVPDDIKQFQGILDNIRMNSNYAITGILCSDDVFYDVADLNTLPAGIRDFYTWKPDIDLYKEWQYAYLLISDCNIAVSRADDPGINGSLADRRNVKGSGLFFRALLYYELSQVFTPAYTPVTAHSAYGLPLKISPDVQDIMTTKRSTVQQTFDRILTDLKESFELLPAVPEVKTRPGKAAASGLLARVYLVLGRYDSSLYYAQASLQQNDLLMDYKDIIPATHSGSVFTPFNSEINLYITGISVREFNINQRVNHSVYQMYDSGDIRKELYFKPANNGFFIFRGSYSGSNSELFSGAGIAVDEMILTRAECQARLGRTELAIFDLNMLRQKRWRDSSTFIPYTVMGQDDVIKAVLNERRRELVFRNTRWMDLRRLGLGIERKTPNGVSFASLRPNDLRYTFLIPPKVILTSGLTQNPR